MSAVPKSLEAFVQKVDALGDVARIEGADWNLEVGCLTELSCEADGPLLLSPWSFIFI